MDVPTSRSDGAGIERAARFFDDFVEAFGSFDGAEVASRYATPFLACGADGSRTCFPTTERVARYFQGVLDGHRARGVVSCRWGDLTVVELGARAMLATVDWELLAEDGAIMNEWRESYDLIDLDGALAVVASIDHA